MDHPCVPFLSGRGQRRAYLLCFCSPHQEPNSIPISAGGRRGPAQQACQDGQLVQLRDSWDSKPSLMQAWWPFWDKCGTHSLWVGGTGSAQTKGWRIMTLLWNLLPGTSLVSLDCRGHLPCVVKPYACCHHMIKLVREEFFGIALPGGLFSACQYRPSPGTQAPVDSVCQAEGLSSVLVTPLLRLSMCSVI